jgi:hypothetical protein
VPSVNDSMVSGPFFVSIVSAAAKCFMVLNLQLPSDGERTDQNELPPSAVVPSTSEDLVPPPHLLPISSSTRQSSSSNDFFQSRSIAALQPTARMALLTRRPRGPRLETRWPPSLHTRRIQSSSSASARFPVSHDSPPPRLKLNVSYCGSSS